MRYVSSCANSGSAAAAVLVMVVAAAAAEALRLVGARAMRGGMRRLSRRSRYCCCGGAAVVVVGHLPNLAGAQRTFLIWQVLCASLVEAVGAQAQLTAQCTGHVRDASKRPEHIPGYQTCVRTYIIPMSEHAPNEIHLGA